MNINSSLQQIRRLTGGKLAGIPLRLRVDMQKIAYRDEKNAAHKSDAPILSIVVRADDLQTLIREARNHAVLFEQARKYLRARRVEFIEDDETEQAKAIQPQFHPENRSGQRWPPFPSRDPFGRGNSAAWRDSQAVRAARL